MLTIVGISGAASKEYSLEKAMQRMEDDWDPITFNTTLYRDTGEETTPTCTVDHTHTCTVNCPHFMCTSTLNLSVVVTISWGN